MKLSVQLPIEGSLRSPIIVGQRWWKGEEKESEKEKEAAADKERHD